MSRRQKIHEACWPAFLATYICQKLNIPAGSMAVVGYAQAIRRDLARGLSKEEIRGGLFMSVFGLLPEEIPGDAP